MPLPESTEPEAFKAFEERSWNAAAHVYHAQLGRLTRRFAPALLDAAGVTVGSRHLDVASGPGYIAALSVARGAKVIGCDLSHEMVELARRDFPGVEFRIGDAEQLTSEDGVFDAVTMSFLLGHVARPAVVLGEALRVLRPGGRLALSWWGPRERNAAFQVVQDSIAAKGRTDVPLPQAPPFDHFSNESGLRGALDETGFARVAVTEQVMKWNVESGEALYDAYLLGTARTAGLLREQTPEAKLAIRADMVERSRPYLGKNGLELPMQVWIASGARPG